MSKAKKEQPVKHPFKGFKNIYLNSQQKDIIRGMAFTESDAVEWIQLMAERGYGVSVNWDYWGSCLQVVVVGKTNRDDAAGWGTSFRHTDLLTAFASAFHMLEQVYPDGSWALEADMSTEFDW